MSELDTARYADLEGAAVFVSGGASGIGADIVEAFCRQGAATVFVDLDAEAGKALSARLAAETGNRPRFIAADVTDDAALRAAIDAAEALGGSLGEAPGEGLAVLVNNAANDRRHDVAEVDPAFWERCVAVNLRHQFVAAQHAFDLMKGRGRGSIINFGSVAPTLRVRDLTVYSTCKSAVRGLTRSLAREFGDHGVRVNSIVPGCILTERQLRLWITPEDEQRILAEQCLHRRLVGRDVAQMALFLASEVSSACSSQEFIVDGGLV